MSAGRVEWVVRTEHDRLRVAEATAGCLSDSDEIVWFESRDASLRSSGEAMGTACLIPALDAGRRLEIDTRSDAVWLRSCTSVLELLHNWWGYPTLTPITKVAEGRDAPPAQLAGLCFSGGVDSFYSLRNGSVATNVLVFVHGFDISIDDAPRVEAYLPALAAIAEATGTRAVVVRTNLRQTAALGAASWERTHGSAMAAVGHLLADSIGRLAISATDHFGYERPWGSQWRLDPLWSSASLEVVHAGADVSRLGKVAAIAQHPLVRRYLRVCWEHLEPSLNCGRCEKCLRTQVMLSAVGALEGFEAFDQRTPLSDRIDHLAPIRSDALHHWDFAATGLPSGVDAAVRRLLERSGAATAKPASTPRSLWARLRRTTDRSR